MDSWVYRPYPPAATPFEGISFLPTVCSILRRARALRQRLKQEGLFPGIQPLPGFLPRVRVAVICITLPTPSPPPPISGYVAAVTVCLWDMGELFPLRDTEL